MDYQLDPKAANAADVKFHNIDTSGKYVGVFTRAEKVTSEKGTRGVDLSFKSNDGAQADYLSLWTHDKDGKELASFKTLNAIMTALRVKSLSAQKGMIEKYVKAQGGRAKVEALLFNELMNKPITLLIQMEESEYECKRNWKPVIYGVADENGFTASEILSQAKKAETLDKMLATLKDKPMRGAAVISHRVESENPAHGLGDNFDPDNIPF